MGTYVEVRLSPVTPHGLLDFVAYFAQLRWVVLRGLGGLRCEVIDEPFPSNVVSSLLCSANESRCESQKNQNFSKLSGVQAVIVLEFLGFST